jgi:excinuclease ABC subunit C
MAETNLEQAIATRIAIDADMAVRLDQLQDALELEQLPARLECFDISHTGGESTVASCVVFDSRGPLKSDYRRYNIEGVAAGDDYGAIHQALRRRYQRIKKGEAPLPDVLFIDGGRGQLAQAEQVMEELQIEGVRLVGVSKGSTRKPGLEKLWLSGRERPLILPAESPALHLIQRIRDEAHRFAIVGHRQRRAKSRKESVLEEIPGLGPKRRQQLLKQFGGLQGIRRAGIEDLRRVPGINQALAQRIYDGFHL